MLSLEDLIWNPRRYYTQLVVALTVLLGLLGFLGWFLVTEWPAMLAHMCK